MYGQPGQQRKHIDSTSASCLKYAGNVCLCRQPVKKASHVQDHMTSVAKGVRSHSPTRSCTMHRGRVTFAFRETSVYASSFGAQFGATRRDEHLVIVHERLSIVDQYRAIFCSAPVCCTTSSCNPFRAPTSTFEIVSVLVPCSDAPGCERPRCMLQLKHAVHLRL